MKYLAFFPTWLPLLRLLPQDRVVPFLEAIVEYATHSIAPKFSTETEKAVFASIRMNIDESISRYNSRSEKLRRNGRLGGLAKSLNRQVREAAEREQVMIEP